VHRKYIQQDATLHSLFISGNSSTCFGLYFHPSSGAHTTVSTASAICHTVSHPQHTRTSSNSSTIASDGSNGVTNTRCVDTVVCAPDDRWKYHPKHVEQFPEINKLCDVASCWIYEYIGTLLGARPILHISRLKVNSQIQVIWQM
jgi:hypothetical protein